MKGNKLLWLSLGLIGVGLVGIITLGMGKTGWMVTMMGNDRMGHGSAEANGKDRINFSHTG